MEKRLASGIGVWFEQEIENALRGIDEVNLDITSVVPTREMEIYRRDQFRIPDPPDGSSARSLNYDRTNHEFHNVD